MKQKHIAIFTIMAAGHVYTCLDVCCELAGRGHRITFPANELFSAKIRAKGLEAIELKSTHFKVPENLLPNHYDDDSLFWRRVGSVDFSFLMLNALAIVDQLQDFYAASPPDLILYDWCNFAGRIFAKFLRRPAIQLCTHFAQNGSMVRLDGAYVTPEPIREVSRVLDNFMSVLGFEGRDQLWHAEPINIFLIPREFQYDVDSFDERFKFVGVTFSSRPPADVWRKEADIAGPILLVSEGSLSSDDRFLRLCIEAFAESRYHVIFLRGIHNTEGSSSLLPRNFEVNRGIANSEVLPISDVAVCQAGMGTTLECLYHGVPVVAVPPDPFNSEVAFRLSELGLGLHVSEREMNPRSLRLAVDRASIDDAIRGRVRCMQELLKNNHGAELAADIIEESFE